MKRAGYLAAAAAMLMGQAPAFALFNNGGFEDGNLNGWSIRWGSTTSGGNDSNWEEGQNWCGYSNWPTHADSVGTSCPLKMQVVDSSTFKDKFWPTQLSRVYNGRYKAMVNTLDGESYPNGNLDITQFKQTDVITVADQDTLGNYNVYAHWAAVMQVPTPIDPLHAHHDMPFVSIRIIIERGGAVDTVYEDFHSADLGASGGWKAVPNTSYLLWRQLKVVQPVQLGDRVTMEAVIGDCGLVGHGAYAYFDQFGSKDVEVMEEPVGECLSASDRFDFRNYTTINGSVSAGNYGSMETDAKIIGDVNVGGNFKMSDRDSVKGNVTLKGVLTHQNIWTITGTLMQNANPPVPSIVQHPVSGLAKWTSFTRDTVLPPGVYGNVSVSSNARVTFVPGKYSFTSLNFNAGSRIIAQAIDGITIESQGDINIGDRTVTTVSGKASNLQWYTNGQIWLGTNLSIQGSFTAPNGTVSLRGSTNLTGLIRAKVINVEPQSVVNCQMP